MLNYEHELALVTLDESISEDPSLALEVLTVECPISCTDTALT
jgi:hypothetical protein